jgi:hypothetical protein
MTGKGGSVLSLLCSVSLLCLSLSSSSPPSSGLSAPRSPLPYLVLVSFVWMAKKMKKIIWAHPFDTHYYDTRYRTYRLARLVVVSSICEFRIFLCGVDVVCVLWSCGVGLSTPPATQQLKHRRTHIPRRAKQGQAKQKLMKQ